MRFAISDIHCHAYTLEALLDRINIASGDQLYVLGDMVNRGPNLSELLLYFRHLERCGIKVKYLYGNHEELLINALKNEKRRKYWLSRGGKESLASFEDLEDLNAKFKKVRKKLRYFIELEDYILVHAGLTNKLIKQGNLVPSRSMYMIRGWRTKFNFELIGNKTVIHGHTPQTESQIKRAQKRMSKTLALNIDAGCYLKNRKGYGRLCALNLDTREIFFQKNIG